MYVPLFADIITAERWLMIMMQWDRLTLGRMAKELGFPRDTHLPRLSQKEIIILTGYSGIVMSSGIQQSIQWHYGSAGTRKKIRSLWIKIMKRECNDSDACAKRVMKSLRQKIYYFIYGIKKYLLPACTLYIQVGYEASCLQNVWWASSMILYVRRM